jgi:hypothetical protein
VPSFNGTVNNAVSPAHTCPAPPIETLGGPCTVIVVGEDPGPTQPKLVSVTDKL